MYLSKGVGGGVMVHCFHAGLTGERSENVAEGVALPEKL